MRQTIKSFLENNIDLIDNNIVEFFMNMYQSSLRFSECREIINMFEEARINYAYARWEALDNIIVENLDDLAQEEYKQDVLLYDFVNFMGNRLGISTLEAKKYIMSNSSKWDNIVELVIDENTIPKLVWR